jgi:hypothetical protein
MSGLDPKEKVLAAVAETLLPALEVEANAARKKGDKALARTLELRGDFSPHVVKEVRRISSAYVWNLSPRPGPLQDWFFPSDREPSRADAGHCIATQH